MRSLRRTPPSPRRRWSLAGIAAAVLLAELARRARPSATPARPLGGRRHGDLEPAAVVVNPGGGSADGVEIDGVPRRELAEGEDLRTVLEETAARVHTLGVAGGDGSVRCAAEVAHARDRVLWVVPGGTLNHFAVALGLVDPGAALEAFRAGHSAPVDLAAAGGELFVNTASVGVYGEVVRRREALEARGVPKGLALVPAVMATLARACPFRVTVDGREERVWLVFVGNGAYSGMGVTGRESLQSGVLDLRVLRARGPFPRVAVLVRLLAGRLRGSPWLRQALVREVRLGLPEPMPLSLDGEVLDDVAGEIAFRSLPGALRVVVPAPERA